MVFEPSPWLLSMLVPTLTVLVHYGFKIRVRCEERMSLPSGKRPVSEPTGKHVGRSSVAPMPLNIIRRPPDGLSYFEWNLLEASKVLCAEPHCNNKTTDKYCSLDCEDWHRLLGCPERRSVQ